MAQRISREFQQRLSRARSTYGFSIDTSLEIVHTHSRANLVSTLFPTETVKKPLRIELLKSENLWRRKSDRVRLAPLGVEGRVEERPERAE